jgi:hypothetical protein
MSDVGVRIFSAQKSKTDSSAVPDASQRDHITSLQIIGSIERLVAFRDILGIKRDKCILALTIVCIGNRDEQVRTKVVIKENMSNGGNGQRNFLKRSHIWRERSRGTLATVRALKQERTGNNDTDPHLSHWIEDRPEALIVSSPFQSESTPLQKAESQNSIDHRRPAAVVSVPRARGATTANEGSRQRFVMPQKAGITMRSCLRKNSG